MIKLGLAALLLLPSGTFNFFPLIFLVAFFIIFTIIFVHCFFVVILLSVQHSITKFVF